MNKILNIVSENGQSPLQFNEKIARMIKYDIFPGVRIVYKNIHLDSMSEKKLPEQSLVYEINHCREGRMECFICGKVFYITPGDISIHKISDDKKENYSSGHYHGVTIQIDLNECPDNLSRFLPDIDVSQAALIDKFHLYENFFFVLRRDPKIEHIFSELYIAPEAISKGYLKIKFLELMLFLDSIVVKTERHELLPSTDKQRKLAENICRYITENLDKKITLNELSNIFDTSETSIKQAFKTTYGVTISDFTKKQRMFEATHLLRETNRTILDIAGDLGYENSSKFARAFRGVIGTSPAQYRKKYHK